MLDERFWQEYLLFCLRMMPMMRPYIPRIPAITTGMIVLKISSGLIEVT